MRLTIRFVMGMLVLLATWVHAQDEKELADLTADSAAQQQSITAAQQDLGKYNGKVTALQGELSSAQEALKQSSIDSSEAKRVYAADSSPANQRLLDRAESGLMLAERKVASINKRLSFSRGKVSELEAKIDRSEAKIAANTQRQSSLKEEIEIQIRAKDEAERRANELAKANKAAQKAALAKPKPPEPKVPAEPALSSDESAKFTALKAIVEEFKTYVESGVKARGDLVRPQAHSSIDGKFPLKHLGGEIYFAEVPLAGGEHRISVGAITYRVMVSADEADKPFTVYFDNRDRHKKKLITYESGRLK